MKLVYLWLNIPVLRVEMSFRSINSYTIYLPVTVMQVSGFSA